MKGLQYSIVCALLLLLGNGHAGELETTFLERAKTIPNPGAVVENDEIIRFEQDLNGDGEPEVFLSKSSLRDGKQGYVWAIYTKCASKENYEEAGLATFSTDAFWPAKWKKDGKSHGFYSYGPGGAGQGRLRFHAFEDGKLKEVETKELSKDEEVLKELSSNAKKPEVTKSPVKK